MESEHLQEQLGAAYTESGRLQKLRRDKNPPDLVLLNAEAELVQTRIFQLIDLLEKARRAELQEAGGV